MMYIKTYENFDNILYSIVGGSKENFEFLSNFDAIPSIESYLSSPRIKIVEARLNDELIACSMFVLKENSVHLNYTFVIDSYRNKGVNQGLKKTLVDWCSKNGYAKITCNVRESNIPSLSSLIKSGFNINTNYNDLKYPDGEKKIPLYYEVSKNI